MEENKISKKDSKEEKRKISTKCKDFWTKHFRNLSSVRQILLWYLIISLTGALLLWLPISQQNEAFNDNPIKFIDALFLSSSAFSDTGLSTITLSEQLNFFGQLITLILLSIGGIGWFTMKIFILTWILKRKTSYNSFAVGASEVGTTNKKETLGLIFSAIIISFFCSLIFGFIFSFIFYGTGVLAIDGETLNYGKSLWAGLFHAAASINNSGLDIFAGNDSLATLYGDEVAIKVGAEVSIQILTMILFIIGGIGFGVFYDVYKWGKNIKTGEKFTFSLITKLSVSVYIAVALIGLFLVYLSEGIAVLGNNNAFLSKDFHDPIANNAMGYENTNVAFRWWELTFNTFSTRNAGFSTMNLSLLQVPTLLIHSTMMFIGSGPGSTAGGLRTTTFGVLFVSIWAMLRNNPKATVFNKAISEERIKKAIVILFASIFLTFSWIIVISIIEEASFSNAINSPKFMDNFFVIFSAFGTTGLSTFDLSNYHWLSKLLIIILMFIGQMGMSTTLSQIKPKSTFFKRQYVEEYVNLG
ncbi:MAG: sodium transporter [Candidatus Tyloplasma litorale]|nr:MAG: sodium transporter [Mycoplasmatales bacterium]